MNNECHTLTQWNDILAGQQLILAYFFSKNFAPCSQFTSLLNDIGYDYEDKFKVVSVDVEANVTIACIYRISIVPTVIFLKRRQKLHDIMGLISKDHLKQIINSFLS